MNSLWMSFRRQAWPLKRYFALAVPVDAAGDLDLVEFAAELLLAVGQQERDLGTSGRPWRVSAPSKMTSCILPPRRAFALCSPRTQRIASAMFDFPHPVGPTTAVTPGSKSQGRLDQANGLEAVEF